MKPSTVSRRGFLHTAGAGVMTMWVPRGARGYTGAEMRAKTSGAKLSVGVSKWELDTPALCVDLDKLDQNLATMKAKLASTGVATRPHAKTHKCPAIAKLQLAAGSIGVCTAKVSEAEALFAGGIERIMMTTCNVTPSKIRRAMMIRKANRSFIQAVDNPQNARDLSDAAKDAGIVADVVIDVAVGTRTGVPADDRALALAQLVDKLPNLKLRGMISYDGGAQHIKGFKARLERSLKNYEPSVETFDRMKHSGLNAEIFSGGGTGTYNIMTKVPGFTDLQVGSYIFMDAQYLEIGGETNDEVFTDFAPSLTVMTTVLNTYFPGRLTTDAGAKALTLNKPDAIVIGEKGFSYNAGSDEFGAIRYETANKTYTVGDKLELIVPHCDPAVNEYDQIYGTRKDRVEVVWPIAARGHSQ
ncbi:MAG TPA: DSD1 family PLP-dependent enzyme [Vicinamibacterales bacterium]|nr:DSD1 family PLP-dependent enzyme [Vicinamibacterales bacterium]